MPTRTHPSDRAHPRRASRRLLAAPAAALALAATLGGAAAQVAHLPREVYDDRLKRDGNRITLCYNDEGMMAGFERDLAEEIGRAALVDVRATPLPATQISTVPLDHRLPMMPEQLFVALAETCSGVVGYALTTATFDWLAVSRPYAATRHVLVARDPSIRRLDDLPLDRPIGTRGLSVVDNRLINYLEALPDDRRWRRMPFMSNATVLDKLRDGAIGLGLVWEPALVYATKGDPEGEGFFVLDELPFDAPSLELAVATRAVDRYINEVIGAAIADLVDDGTVEALMEAHALKPRVAR